MLCEGRVESREGPRHRGNLPRWQSDRTAQSHYSRLAADSKYQRERRPALAQVPLSVGAQFTDEFSLVLRLVVIALLIPADTSECERVFSLMNDLKKSECRSRINQST